MVAGLVGELGVDVDIVELGLEREQGRADQQVIELLGNALKVIGIGQIPIHRVAEIEEDRRSADERLQDIARRRLHWGERKRAFVEISEHDDVGVGING